MTNVAVLTGTVKEMPTMRTTSKGNNVAHLILETERNFRNEDGSVTTDCFDVTVWRGAAEEVMSICKPGSKLNVKGRLQGSSYEKNGKMWYNTEFIAEQIDYLVV